MSPLSDGKARDASESRVDSADLDSSEQDPRRPPAAFQNKLIMGLQEADRMIEASKLKDDKAKDLVDKRRRAEEKLTKLRTVDFVEKLAAGSTQTRAANKAPESNNGSCAGSPKRA